MAYCNEKNKKRYTVYTHVLICKSLEGRFITGASHKTKQKTALHHVQNRYNAIYTRLALDSRSCHPVKTNYRVFTPVGD